MYSDSVTAAAIERLEARLGVSLLRFPAARVADIAEHLSKLRKPDGALKRSLTKEEQSFIRNERLVSQQDFSYWVERYCTIARDAVEGGGIGPFRLWESQQILLRRIAECEERGVEAWSRRETADGILIVDHKDRQVGHTMLARALLMHRLTLHPHTRGMAASVDDDKVQELYDRDKLIWDNLPWYLKPSLEFDVKAAHLYFGILGSRLLYQQGKQQSGLGQGRQFDVAHITEVASLPYPAMLEHDFFPTLPQNPYTLCLLESTAQGRGNYWHDFTERVRRGRTTRWVYVFVPYYAEKKKYRRTAPSTWHPSELTLLHAKRVYETSREFTGQDVLLSRETLYWYETTRQEYQDAGRLNLFLTNYAATPEESFQHTTLSAFSTEVMERIRLDCRPGVAYEFANIGSGRSPRGEAGAPSGAHAYGGTLPTPTPTPPSPGFTIQSRHTLTRFTAPYDGDPRGLVWIYEPPQPKAAYVMGIDPTVGITSWDRSLRTEDDFKTDNGAIEIIRLGRNGKPDVQVAEYAAPIDPEDLADVANALGRLYAGSDEDEQCLCIIEVYPGPGLLTLRKMINDYGYTRHFVWKYLDSLQTKPTNSLGWQASPKSVRDLWIRGSRHINRGDLLLRSDALTEEMTDCEQDPVKMTAKAVFGRHDDRVRAVLLCLWAAHDWSMQVEMDTRPAVELGAPAAPWQASDMSYDRLLAAWEERFSALSEES